MPKHAIKAEILDLLAQIDAKSPHTINQAIVKANGIVRFIGAMPGSPFDYGGRDLEARFIDPGAEIDQQAEEDLLDRHFPRPNP